MAAFFEEVVLDQELPALTRRPNLVQLVRWAGASENLHPVHYDPAVAQALGLPDVLVHGRLKAAFIAQMLTSWAGPQGSLRQLSLRYLGMDFPGQDLVCQGKVVSKSSGEPLVECEVWLENPRGEVTVRGTALVALPRRTR